tara:strand:- start:1058 stop:2701 length:1644 start_codon:yes stop_codon:yes gene_type:complete
MTKNRLIFGEIENVEPGDIFDSRKELNKAGIHGPTMGGIWGRENEGACSIVLSGGYEDDIDDLDYIKYTGQGGQDAPGGKQVADQVFRRGNLALKISCDNGYPVRVTRGFQVQHGPKSGYRYDGLYFITSYERVKGKRGFYVCRFDLNRHQYSQKITPVKKIIKTSKKRPFKNLHIEDLEKKSDSKEFEVEVLNELNYRNTVRSKRLKTKLKLRNSLLENDLEKDIQKDSFQELSLSIKNQFFADKELSKFPLKTRTLNALQHAGLEVIGDLSQWSSSRLLQLPNFGKLCLDELRKLLQSLQNCQTEEELKSILNKRLDKKFEVYVSKYNQGLTLSEIGQHLNITREAVRQNLVKAKRNGYEIVSTKENSTIRSEKKIKSRLKENLLHYKDEIMDLYKQREPDTSIAKTTGLKPDEVKEILEFLIKEDHISEVLVRKKRRRVGDYDETERFNLIISMRDEGATIRQVAKAAGVSPAAISANIALMKSRGIRVPGSVIRQDLDLETRYYRNSVIKREKERGTSLEDIATMLGISREILYRHIRLFMDE